jgi:hypothetical protein
MLLVNTADEEIQRNNESPSNATAMVQFIFDLPETLESLRGQLLKKKRAPKAKAACLGTPPFISATAAIPAHSATSHTFLMQSAATIIEDLISPSVAVNGLTWRYDEGFSDQC